MLTLTPFRPLYTGLLLAFFMMATGSHALAPIPHLPEASWAVFFLAGVLLRPAWVFPAFCVLTAVIDWVNITWGGVSSFCVTAAYPLLLPAYGSLWLGGRWYARHHRETLAALAPFAGTVLLSAFAAELFSSGGFYFFGGRFTDPTLAGFLPRLMTYFPASLGAMMFYAGLAAVVYGWLATRIPSRPILASE